MAVCLRSVCTLPFPNRVCGVGVCAWVWVLGCAPPLPGEVLGCVCVCVLFPRGPLHLLAGGAVRGCVLGPGLLPRPATPGWSVGACVCLCWCPACTPPFLAGVCGVDVRAGLRFRLCAAPLGWVVGVCVCSCVYPPCTPSFLGGRLWRGGVRVLSWLGFVPPPPLWDVFSFGGAPWRVVSLLCGVGRWMSGSWVPRCPSPLPLSFGLRLCVFFVLFFSCSQRGVCRRVCGVPCSGGPLLPVWCCRFCLGGPRVPLRGVPSSVPSGWGVGPPFVAWVGGFVAVGLSRAPPPAFFLEGGPPVPPSAFPGLVHALVGIRCGLPGSCWCLRFARPCPGPMGRVGYVHVGLGDPSCWVRFWLCRPGGCARRLREALR